MNSLGERIYELRKQNNMSQGDLAEKLDVSRQTISKWENNSSLPEIEKIAQLSMIFSVTTDFIITGKEEKVQLQEEKEETPLAETKEKNITNGRRIAAIILIVLGCVALVVFSFTMQLLTLAGIYLIGLGVLLLLCKKHTALFISWYSFILLEKFLSSFTTINMRGVFHEHYYTDMYRYHLILAFAMWIVFAILALCTIVAISKSKKKQKQ